MKKVYSFTEDQFIKNDRKSVIIKNSYITKEPVKNSMKNNQYTFPVQIYYEDTDHSGVVYYANYLKYFERAREAVIGKDILVQLWNEDGLGFAVYKADLNFLDGAEFGDILDIRSTVKKESQYRLIWQQEAWRPEAKKPAVTAFIHLVCIDKNRKLKTIPEIPIKWTD